MEKPVPARLLHDQRLPYSTSSKLAGWASTARLYPIFGKTWFGYRMLSFAAPLAFLAAMLGALAAFMTPARRGPGDLYVALAAVWVVVALALFLGRALAVLVCTRRWGAPREAAGVAGALLFGVLAALPLTPYTHIAQAPRVSQVPTAQQLRSASETRVFNFVLWFLVLAWLGGGLDFLAWLRQRRLLRETDLLGQVARYKDERNEVEMRLAILASQVEPHFLFNTLSGVRAAMTSDPARGIAMIDHLVDYLRATIPQLRADHAISVVPLGSQLDAAQAYLGIIAARLPRLRACIDCPAGLRHALLPPLMLISLVENAVKHGIELKKGPGLIHITATPMHAGGAALLELSVRDDGMGFGSATTGSGIGLANIRERLQHLYGDAASLSLRAGTGGGVVASIVLPLTLGAA